MIARAVMIACLAACGGAARPADDDGPSCQQVAAHLVVLAEEDNATPVGEDLGAGIYAEAERQCAAWSPPRRRCLAAAPTQDATLACPRG